MYVYYFENISINWLINTLLIEKISFGQYDVVVLQRGLSILGIISLAAGLFMETAILYRDNI